MEKSDLLAEVRKKAQSWLSQDFDEATRVEVQRMMEEDENLLIEAFYKDLEFGTGGLRGIMGPGTNRVNLYTIGMATQGLCNYLKKQFDPATRLKVVVTHDCRNNSRLFAETTSNVLSANGIEVFLTEEMRPTPELSFAIRHLKCQSGVVVTASHNPREYNGYKVYWEDGGQIVEPHDTGIIEEVNAIQSINEVKFKGQAELIHLVGEDLDQAYLDTIQKHCLKPAIIKSQADIGIVYTPIHGSGVIMVPKALKKLGFRNILNVPEQDIEDGNFPTVVSPNPEEQAALNMAIEKAKESGAELVMATDPDGDRIGIAVKDEQGEFVLLNGNQTGSLMVYYLLKNLSEQKKLKGNEFIARTVVTTPLFDEIATSFNVNSHITLTGFKHIAALIRNKEGKETFIGGGEESYGFMIGSEVRDKDGVASAALIAEIAAWAQSRGLRILDILDEIHQEYGVFQEHLISVVKKGRNGSEEIANMMESFRNTPPESLAGSDVVTINDFLLRKSYDQLSHLRYDITLPKSNVLQYITQDGTIFSARPSGTEPKIKFYFSVRSDNSNRSAVSEIRAELQAKIERIIEQLNLRP